MRRFDSKTSDSQKYVYVRSPTILHACDQTDTTSMCYFKYAVTHKVVYNDTLSFTNIHEAEEKALTVDHAF